MSFQDQATVFDPLSGRGGRLFRTNLAHDGRSKTEPITFASSIAKQNTMQDPFWVNVWMPNTALWAKVLLLAAEQTAAVMVRAEISGWEISGLYKIIVVNIRLSPREGAGSHQFEAKGTRFGAWTARHGLEASEASGKASLSRHSVMADPDNQPVAGPSGTTHEPIEGLIATTETPADASTCPCTLPRRDVAICTKGIRPTCSGTPLRPRWRFDTARRQRADVGRTEARKAAYRYKWIVCVYFRPPDHVEEGCVGLGGAWAGQAGQMTPRPVDDRDTESRESYQPNLRTAEGVLVDPTSLDLIDPPEGGFLFCARPAL